VLLSFQPPMHTTRRLLRAFLRFIAKLGLLVIFDQGGA
jgi:hypothetical protein